jgi:phenylacetate-CoA ligase
VVSSFAPDVSGNILVRPQAAGVKQEPPLPVRVELSRGATADAALADAIRDRLRSALVVQTRVELVPWGSLQRSEYKSKLVEHQEHPSDATETLVRRSRASLSEDRSPRDPYR